MQKCILDEGPEKENGAEESSIAKSLSKSKKLSVIRTVHEDPGDDLVFQVNHKVSYKTVLKGKTPCTFVAFFNPDYFFELFCSFFGFGNMKVICLCEGNREGKRRLLV